MFSASNGIEPIFKEKEKSFELFDITKGKNDFKQILVWVKKKIVKSLKRYFHGANDSTDNWQNFWRPLSVILIGITFGLIVYLILPPSFGAIGLGALGFWIIVFGVIMIFKRINKLE